MDRLRMKFSFRQCWRPITQIDCSTGIDHTLFFFHSSRKEFYRELHSSSLDFHRLCKPFQPSRITLRSGSYIGIEKDREDTPTPSFLGGSRHEKPERPRRSVSEIDENVIDIPSDTPSGSFFRIMISQCT